ncbi:response regulator transcription factor [Bacillus sp. BRMEA1]|uniref:response regulator n=1 Tax=Neobacillus endophyticus TaxID=2738405 RepID=UPI001566D72C|nr:response regulator transcription factor [Neobacillus endophyticus]NRD81027.1 response regulator transcription factor [Neobacillus endophyticus]
MAIKVAIIDGQSLFREGVKKILENESFIQVVAEGNDGSRAINLVATKRPDIIIMDINLPRLDGIKLTRELLVQYPYAKIIILSLQEDEQSVTEAISSGVKGYILKDTDSNHLIGAINVVADGGAYLDPKIAHLVVNGYRTLVSKVNSGQIRRPLHLLTRRECDVLRMLAYGKSNRGISEALRISEKTIKNHVSNILQKMNVKDRTQAVVTAIKNGWVEVF